MEFTDISYLWQQLVNIKLNGIAEIQLYKNTTKFDKLVEKSKK